MELIQYDREANDLRFHTDESAFAKACAEGRAMTIEQAIAFALD
jgi:hypothetical protein